MNFVKKNLGLLIFTLVCLGLSVAFGLAIRGAIKSVAKSEEVVQKQKDFFKKVSRSKFALSKTNLATATANHQQESREFSDLRRELYKRFQIPRMEMSGLEFKRYLDNKCREMRRTLSEKDVAIGANCAYFSFDSVAKSSVLLPNDTVPSYLRHLQIMEELVKLTAGSYLKELRELDRINDLKDRDESFYLATPLQITVVGSQSQIMDYANALHLKSKYFFALKSISFSSKQELIADARKGGADKNKKTDSGQAGLGPGRRPPAGRAAPVVEKASETPEVLPPRTREERLAFSPSLLTATLMVDLLEFKDPDPKEE
jgi:hypothetical protein